MSNERIDKWLSSRKRNLFKYKDGFFELPYVSNSPETIVKSLTSMPFVRGSKELGFFGVDNDFIKVEVKYHEIEQGLWVVYSDSSFKENIFFKREHHEQLPGEYYSLILEVSKQDMHLKKSIVNGVSYSNCSWMLFKPKTGLTNCRFKESEIRSCTIFFHEDWLKNIVYKNDNFINSSFRGFMESEAKFVLWPDTLNDVNSLIKAMEKLFGNKIDLGEVDLCQWQELALEFISYFIEKYNVEEIGRNLLAISNIDRKKLLQAEKMLTENIQGSFMGIDVLSVKIGMSSTKLKNNFKLVFGDTIFQYFRKKQLDSACVILSQEDLSVKEVALLFGYKSPSKFTMAYKGYFGELPSEK